MLVQGVQLLTSGELRDTVQQPSLVPVSACSSGRLVIWRASFRERRRQWRPCRILVLQCSCMSVCLHCVLRLLLDHLMRSILTPRQSEAL